MARIAYLDHSFHRTTKSTAFLPEILVRHGHHVDFFWDDAWQGGAPVAWTDVCSYDVVIMFQSYCQPERRYFRQSHSNVVYIPMLDQFGIWQGPVFNLSAFWEPFQGSKVLNFSNAVHCMTTGFGVVSHFARYYQSIEKTPPPPSRGLHGFFWLRREQQLPWRVIRKLIENTRFDSFHIHLANDPGTPSPELPTAEDVAKHRITTSVWFEKKADLNGMMARANVFFAPRLEEGIGQSFIEAMCRGQCVVAPNQGSMNEYILPGVNGLLYDNKNPQPLDFSRVHELGAEARNGALAGRVLWEKGEAELVRFILTPSEALYVGKYQHAFLSDERPLAPPAVVDPAVVLKPGDSLTRELRRLAQHHAIFKSTRFLWHPLVRLVRNITGRRA